MKNNKPDAEGDSPDLNPEEDLRIENELLQIKLKAETGVEFLTTAAITPELENTFLKNVLEFEEAYANTRQVKIFDFLGKPDFKKSSELRDDEIDNALEDICAIMAKKNLEVDFSGNYDPRVKYAFITEELFEHETDDIYLSGMTSHYIYEEFHPNHQMDIESRSIRFLTNWFKRKFDAYSWELSETFLLPDKTLLSKKEVLVKMKKVFAAYAEFSNPEYVIGTINYEMPEPLTGTGCCKGTVSYDAVLESGEKIHFEGPFILHLSLEDDSWGVEYFIIPGFNWES